MFDSDIFDTDIFDCGYVPPPPSGFRFGRTGRKFERRLFNPFFFSIPIIGIAIRLYAKIHTIFGIPFRRMKTPLLARGVPYRAFNKEAKISRKRRYTMLEMEAIET